MNYYFGSVAFSEGSYLQFMSDEFLRLLLCRHVFASVVLRVHRSFRSRPKNHPTSHPPLPDLDVVENPTLQRYTLDLALQGNARAMFQECMIQKYPPLNLIPLSYETVTIIRG